MVLRDCRILPNSNLCARRPDSRGRAAAGGALRLAPWAFDDQKVPLADKTGRALCLRVRVTLSGHRIPQASQAFVFIRLPLFPVRAIRSDFVSVRQRESIGGVSVGSGRAKGRIRGQPKRGRTRRRAARHAEPWRLRSKRSGQKMISAPYTTDQNHRRPRHAS
jgi:hypothetical protein